MRPGRTEGVRPAGGALPGVWAPSALSKRLEGPPPAQNHPGHAGCICPHSPSGHQPRPCWTEGVETPDLSPLPLCGCLQRTGDHPGGPCRAASSSLATAALGTFSLSDPFLPGPPGPLDIGVQVMAHELQVRAFLIEVISLPNTTWKT